MLPPHARPPETSLLQPTVCPLTPESLGQPQCWLGWGTSLLSLCLLFSFSHGAGSFVGKILWIFIVFLQLSYDLRICGLVLVEVRSGEVLIWVRRLVLRSLSSRVQMSDGANP